MTTDCPRPAYSWRPWLVFVVVLGVVASSTLVGFSLAAFSDTTNNTGSSFSAATSFCGSPGTQTLVADADTWVAEDQPSTKRGSQTSLEVQSRAGGRNRRVLVHFALPAAQFCTVASATLRLNATSSDPGRTMEAYRAVGAWTESAVTWSTQPAATGAPATAAASTGWVQLDVTSQVQELYATGNDGFLVKDSAEGQNPARRQAYDSKESSGSPPELVVTFA
jgi:hypothetical protein